MRIHSSSLNFSAAAYNSYKAGAKYGAANKNASTSRATLKQPELSSIEEIKQSLEKSTSLSLVHAATDLKTLKALNAYIQELNQPLQDRNTQLISGIDTYA